jgi:2,4-dichlorophenol 6-monooxygenase
LSIVTGLSGQAWVTAAEELGLPFLRTVVVGGEVVKDPYGNWAHIREIEEGGVLLIRPDGYVAWRHRAAVYKPEDARRLLSGALTRLLGASVIENVHA